MVSLPCALLLSIPAAHADVDGRPTSLWWGDFDADGRLDAYVVEPDGSGRLLRNAGEGAFRDVTEETGLAAFSGARMAAWADADGDGRLDLYLASDGGRSHLLLQSEGGAFEDTTRDAGLPSFADIRHAAWIDYDADGRPDLWLTTKVDDLVYHNEGRGRFERVDLGLAPRLPLVRDAAAANPGLPPLDPTVAGPGVTTQSMAGLTADLICALGVQDASSPANCLGASSDPMLGYLYPISNEWYVASGTGRVGIGTTSPVKRLHVAGSVRADEQLISDVATGTMPLLLQSTTRVDRLNADFLDGFHASAFSQLGDSIGTAELENGSVTTPKLADDAVTAQKIATDAVTADAIGSAAVWSNEIANGAILDVDVASNAAIQGTKVVPDFGAQNVTTTGRGDFSSNTYALNGSSIVGPPTEGFAGVQGSNDYAGVASADWLGLEIGVAGISTGTTDTDNYGVMGHSNHVGVRGEHAGNPSSNFGELGTSGTGVYGSGVLYGVEGSSNNTGVLGTGAANGVWGTASGSAGTGVLGISSSTSGAGRGVYGRSLSTTGFGVYGYTPATSGTNYGVYGITRSTSGRGVRGHADSSTGFTRGVWGSADSPNATGVRGEVFATSGPNIGVAGRTHSSSGWGIVSYGATGTTGQKSFIQPHPSDPSKEIRYYCLEGDESGTYFRGKARTEDGVFTIDVPESFRFVSSPDDITVTATAVGAPALVWVESFDLETVVVRSSVDVDFHYTVNGVRRGFEELETVFENHAFVPDERGVPYGTQYPVAYRRILVENGILNPDFTPNEATAAALGWTLAEPGIEEALEAEHAARRSAREAEIAEAHARRAEARAKGSQAD